MEQLRIDPEFKCKIPPLTEAEYFQLRDNILADGEVREPIVVWNGIIVDGHNRWRIIQENPGIPYKTREMNFADKWAAFDWMYKNQLGRRNLTEQQETYLRGKLYEARKHVHGGDRRSIDFSRAQNAPLKEKQSTAEELGRELGLNHATIKRSEQYAHGIDAIRECDNETADAILTGKLAPKKADIIAIAKACEDDRTAMIERMKKGEPVLEVEIPGVIKAEINRKYNGGGTAEYRERRDKIAETVADMYDQDKKVEFTFDDLLQEIKWNAESYIYSLNLTIQDHKDILTNGNGIKVKVYIQNNVIDEIQKLKEEI